jgi:hypothetical protein
VDEVCCVWPHWPSSLYYCNFLHTRDMPHLSQGDGMMLLLQGIDYVATPEAADAMKFPDTWAAEGAMERSQAASHSSTGAVSSKSAEAQSLQHFYVSWNRSHAWVCRQ